MEKDKFKEETIKRKKTVIKLPYINIFKQDQFLAKESRLKMLI